MNYVFGNKKQLESDDQFVKLIITDKTKLKPININAAYQPKPLFITLPHEPHLLQQPITIQPVVQPVSVQHVVQQQPTIISKEDHRLDLLNFIDIDKLTEGRSGKNKSYFLNDLKELAKKLNLFKNQTAKQYFVNEIKNALIHTFDRDPNLIADIKKLDDQKIKHLKTIEELFVKHHISKSTTTSLLFKIKSTLKKFSTSTQLQDHVIETIENEWKPVKK
ncbi:MAG TPA: hypothetical protein VLG50_07620 [Candidatus Saccharimonadales bacterium]|nr:hypothetical protein [Candidatus Saccharimonadales bacterium]